MLFHAPELVAIKTQPCCRLRSAWQLARSYQMRALQRKVFHEADPRVSHRPSLLSLVEGQQAHRLRTILLCGSRLVIFSRNRFRRSPPRPRQSPEEKSRSLLTKPARWPLGASPGCELGSLARDMLLNKNVSVC